MAKITTALHDGFANLLARMGVGVGNTNTGHFRTTHFLTHDQMQLEGAYRTNWLAGVAVDAIAEDMTKQGINLHGLDDAETMQTFLVNSGCWSALTDAIRWSRLYGGAIAYINIEGQDPSSPLLIDRIPKGSFAGLMIFDRHQIQPNLSDIIQSGPSAGLPASYTVIQNDNLGIQSMIVHHTRVIRFIGNRLPARQAAMESTWGASVLEKFIDRLISFENANAGAAQLIQKAHLRVVKINKMREVFAQGGQAEANLIKSFEHMRLMQSIEGLTLLDKNDDFQTSSYSFSGLSDVMLHLLEQISGALGIPLVRLMGQSPAGLNATGQSDLQNYSNTIHQKQENDLREGISRLIAVVHRSLFGIAIPDSASFDFIPLHSMSVTEKVAVSKTVTDTVIAAHGEGLISTGAAVKELKSIAEITGVYHSITQEDIEEAMNELPTIDMSQGDTDEQT